MELTFKNHVWYLKSSCQEALDTLRVVGHTDWRADRIILVRVNHSLVRSKLDYGRVVYGSARQSVLRALNPIHHEGWSWMLGLSAHLMLKVISLYVEAHEPSLASRRLKRALNCVLKLKSLPENPSNSCVFEPEKVKLFADSPSKIRHLGVRMLPHLEKSKINLGHRS